ncbi:MAG: CAP domain-containing protein [Chloroflexi bacterium]|nr:CAP domain-containing protein [Chloroflexota bacterium]
MSYQRMALALALLAALALGPGAVSAQDDAGWLIGQVNNLRASTGIAGVVPNGQLGAAAYQHSEYMATTCDVSHTESNGSTPADRAAANGYAGSRVIENIYGGGNAGPSRAWEFWINSPIHYNGMVNPSVNEIGIGIARGACGTFFTMVLGYRADVTAPPAPPPPAAAPADGVAVAAVPQAAPPTAAPYVPPPPSRTPTPTIPTLTPLPTWTITPTYTPPPTGTPQPPTSTPLVLPTVPAPGEATAVAQVPPLAPDGEPVLAQPSSTPAPVETSAALAPVAAQAANTGGGFSARDLVPFALVGQLVLIGVLGFVYFRRTR